jgi:hypothetical protein
MGLLLHMHAYMQAQRDERIGGTQEGGRAVDLTVLPPLLKTSAYFSLDPQRVDEMMSPHLICSRSAHFPHLPVHTYPLPMPTSARPHLQGKPSLVP